MQAFNKKNRNAVTLKAKPNSPRKKEKKSTSISKTAIPYTPRTPNTDMARFMVTLASQQMGFSVLQSVGNGQQCFVFGKASFSSAMSIVWQGFSQKVLSFSSFNSIQSKIMEWIWVWMWTRICSCFPLNLVKNVTTYAMVNRGQNHQKLNELSNYQNCVWQPLERGWAIRD